MTASEIIKLLNILIGGTEAIGETRYDEVAKLNLMNLIDIINWCLDRVSDSAKTRHEPAWSMRDVGERAFGAMCEWKVWLEESIADD
jgi:hypothetical protein